MRFTARTASAVAIFILALLPCTRAMGTTFTVTTTADNGNDVTPTAGSLRAAIVAANLDNTAMSGSPHQINFQAGLSGTITLANTLPALNRHISINGPGAGVLAVSGANTYRIFTANAPFTIAIKGLTIRNGFVTNGASGGGIASNAQLTVTDCYFDGNHAGFNGGAINTYDGTGATATIQRCTFTDNSVEPSGNGGAVCNGTFTTNVTNSVTMTLTNCTFTDNHGVGALAWGGAVANSGTMSVINCTITDNDADVGGGIVTYRGTTTLRNTIVANNTAASVGPNIDNTQGTVTSGGHNLIEDNSGGASGSFTNGVNGDIVGIDPVLGSLQDNGGPTQTIAPLYNSPAIDAGGLVSGLATDQRGTNYPRVEDLNAFANATGGNGSDIGALEVRRFIVNITGDGADATAIGDGLADTDLGTGGDQTSLRAAEQETEAYPDFNVIEFAIGATGSQQTITHANTGPYPVINNPLYVDGWSQGGAGYSGQPLVELDGSNILDRWGFNIQAPGSTIRGLAVNGFRTTSSNGIAIGVFNAGNSVWIYGCWIGIGLDGTTARPNTYGVVLLSGTGGNIVGTDGDGNNDDAERNLVSASEQAGIYLSSNGNVVAGNYIGTDASGTGDRGNSVGVQILSASNLVGTDADGSNDAVEGNLISGNSHGVIISGISATGNVVAGNYIGTAVNGVADLGNSTNGILVQGTTGTNTIGGATAAARNVISGNDYIAVNLIDADNTVVIGNYIGLGADGTTVLGTPYGIPIQYGSNNNRIGGTAPGEGNVITGMTYQGISNWYFPVGTGNRYLGNSIYNNGALGIDIGVDGAGQANGVTPNDAGDPDAGWNNLQNFAVMTDVKLLAGGDLNVTYNVPSSSANSAYPLHIEFFKSDGSGEGKTLIGTDSYTTPATTASVTFTPATSMGVGDEIVATATDANGNTSEFSPEATVTPTITDQPDALTVCAPDQAQFSVSATGSGLTYQWRKDGSDLSDGGNISGSNTATLTIDPTSPSDNGSYDVIVSGSQSDPATLTVNAAPVVTDDPDNNAPPACPGSDVSFTAAASGAPTPTVQWQLSTDNGVTWNDLSGETSTTLTVSGVTPAMDGYQYHAVFTNDCSTATTAAATLDVDNPPTFTVPSDITVQCDESTDPSNTGEPTDVTDDYGTPTIGYSDASTPGSCGNGQTITRTWTATDACGNSTSHDQTITVQDTDAPTITLSSTAIEFWPPNHDYHTVTVSDFVTGVSDNCSSLSVSNIVITSVTSDEPEDANGNGDGKTLNDIVINNDCHSVQLREERNGNGNGRVYRIHVAISDGCGNIATASFPVSVRKNQGGAAAIEGAAVYTVNATCATPKMVQRGPDQPQTGNGFYLMQNYPNPFNPSTVIEYSISTSGPVHLTIVDASGRTVATLVDEEQNAGEHSISFDCGELPSGTYYYVLESDGQRLDKSMILSK